MDYFGYWLTKKKRWMFQTNQPNLDQQKKVPKKVLMVVYGRVSLTRNEDVKIKYAGAKRGPSCSTAAESNNRVVIPWVQFH